jgi:hypothetical protein
VALLAATGPPARAAGGVIVRWDHCRADGGTQNRLFACNTNSGSERIVCSYQTDAPIVNVSGAEVTLDLRADASSLPLWWQFKNTGTCRAQALGMSTTADGAWVGCLDQWNGQATGGIGAYHIGLLAPTMARIRAAAAVPQSALFTVEPGIEYFVCNFSVSHAKTVGSGACGGCTTPLCLLFANLVITTPVAANNRVFNTPQDGVSSHWAGWQGGVARDPNIVCDADGCNYHFGCWVAPVTARSRGWGALKELFR